MSHIIMETGKYAETPYFFDKTYVNLYSVEELCYCLAGNAEFLDQKIVSDKLARWLDEQCGLSALAHSLFSLVNQKGSPAAYVGTILEYAGLYSEEEIAQIETVIKNNAGLSPCEKQKTKADYLLQNKRYALAMEQYEALLEQLPEEEIELRGKIRHNMGVVNASLFLFEYAAEDFLEAYRINGNVESLRQHLIARRMGSKDKEYIEYIAKNPNYHELSLQVERLIDQAKGQFDTTDENRMLFTLKVCKEEGNSTAGSTVPYYSEIEKITNSLKDTYRENMAE